MAPWLLSFGFDAIELGVALLLTVLVAHGEGPRRRIRRSPRAVTPARSDEQLRPP